MNGTEQCGDATGRGVDVESGEALSRNLVKLRERLQDLRGRSGLSMQQLRLRAGLGRTTLSQALNHGPTHPSWGTVAAIAKAVGLGPEGLDELHDLWKCSQPPSPPSVISADRTGVYVHEQLIADVGPQALEVHRAVLAAPDPGGYPFLTSYMPRRHDDEIRTHLAPALSGGESVLVMLTGDSATGKTRALFEALTDLAPQRRLLRPSGSSDLLHLLLQALFGPGTVLWLNEAQRFFYGHDAEQAAAELRQRLVTTPGLVAVGTLWTDPYWEELTRPGRTGDPHGQVRGLLDCSAARRVMVPDHFSDSELVQWHTMAQAAEVDGDRRLADALRAGAADGLVVQHLSGGPALLAAYRSGPGSHFNHVEHAVLTAALDARRLGHRSPLPAGLLADAAAGALHPRRRPSGAAWAEGVLTALSTGERDDGRRTDIRHTLTAMHRPLTRPGDEALFEPADYLVQHVRPRHKDRPGTPSLWHALLDHTRDADDLVELATSARDHGYLTQAVHLWHKAVLVGHPTCAHALAELLDEAKDPQAHGSVWAARHTPLRDPDGVRLLVEVLAETGRHTAMTALMRRMPEAHVDCDDAESVAHLLMRLRAAGQDVAAARLAARAAKVGDATDAGGSFDLLEALRTLGLDEAYHVLAVRTAREADTSDMAFTPALLAELNAYSPIAANLAIRAAASIDIGDTTDVWLLLDALREEGLHEAITVLLRRQPEEHVGLHEPEAVAWLVDVLDQLDQTEAVHTLFDRGAATFADLSDPDAVSLLLRTLLAHQRDAEFTALATRAAEETDISDPALLAELIEFLHQLGMEAEITTLLDRGVAARTDVRDPESVGRLIALLDKMGKYEAVALLAHRAASDTDVTDPDGAAWLLESLEEVGQIEATRQVLSRIPPRDVDEVPVDTPVDRWGFDLDGTPAGHWTWDDLGLS
ncbi:helix-turn-helix domain-containing protein [Streptomyces sp. G7(2002)]|uniref:helix-turn-helix domain-containing protein n=1 Tax=Streptomyces sp. G7(2002) TaxID=2971798 RepID=UPI00237E36D9|nr:helix-turn-helix transcriptional regulator [Streptomyces sp. G7(2002)]WDT58449.1 helix-turn-helix domain-containing protein [Streptomyces sp. G7(2002)]